MMDFQQKHSAYKFQIAVSIVSHKAIDPALLTQPPVTITSEMVAVYAVYEQNGSGWVFFKLCFLKTDIMAT